MQVVDIGVIHFFLGYLPGRYVWVAFIEAHEQEALFVGDEVEHVEYACGGGQGAIVAVDNAVKSVICGV